MKAIQLELPDKLAAEIEGYVRTGWFNSEAEVIRAALIDFVRRNRVDLLERFFETISSGRSSIRAPRRENCHLRYWPCPSSERSRCPQSLRKSRRSDHSLGC
jgi:Arc/MetJ-type ribon-helix-helix transcriptional regulator